MRKPKPRTPVARKPSGDPLRRYHAKRNLAVSGEPGGSSPRRSARGARAVFVIQKHDATRLHYDVRLEMDGVYKSWAVPKGLPERTGDKTLAVEVEDHPLDYGTFEGVIPAGNYGAGTVMVWDRGTYEVSEGSALSAYRRGKLRFVLAGEKCRGEWTLVRMRGEGEKKNWLLIKNSETGNPHPIRSEGRDLSVKSRRSLEEIADGRARAGSATRRTAPRKSPARSVRSGSKKNDGAPGYIEPMKVLGVTTVPPGDWLLEVKFDGFRALAVIAAGRTELWSRNEKPLAGDFPQLATSLAALPCRDAVIDGEIVALDEAGRPSFQALQNARRGRAPRPLLYYAFDLLHLDGASLLARPIEERKAGLAALLAKAPEQVRLSPVFRKDPAEFLAEVRAQGFEGMVAKTPGSVYEPGRRSGTWLKCRIVHEQEFVIGGFTQPDGARKYFGALLVGYYDGDRLRYAGKVGTGFDAKGLKLLHGRLKPLARASSPFVDLSRQNGATWVEPTLVGQFKFSEWTRDGLLRQPVFLGLRADKEPREVTREPVAGE